MTQPDVRFQSIVPQFTVPDVVRTAEYYRDVWGFKISGYWMDPPVGVLGVELLPVQEIADELNHESRFRVEDSMS